MNGTFGDEVLDLLSDLGVGVVVLDRAGRVVRTNRHGRDLVGITESSHGHIDVHESVHRVVDETGEVVEVDQLPGVQALRTGRSVPGKVLGFRYLEESGREETMWLLGAAHVLPGDDGAPAEVVTTFVDVTNQREAQAAVRESEQRFRLLAENAADLIFRVSLRGQAQFEFVNAAVRDLLGYEPEDLYADPDYGRGILHPDDYPAFEQHLGDIASSVRRDGEPYVVRMVRRDGQVISVELKIVPVLEGRDVVALEGIARDVTEQEATVADLSYQAAHDDLTGLWNRGSLLRALEQVLLRPRRGVLAVLYVDLDRFKTVNDNLGHEVGDRVLATVASRLAEAIRPSDFVARLGGDEFAAVLPEVRDAEEALQVAQRLLTAVGAAMPLDGGELVTTASIGVTFCADGGPTAAELLRRADVAMYRAKDHGRARVECYEGPSEPGPAPGGPPNLAR